MFTEFQIGATVVDLGHRKRLKFDDDAVYLEHVNELGTGVHVVVTIEEERDRQPKTSEQRKYWFAVPCVLVGEHCGMTKDQASHAMLGECFGYIDGPTGKPVPLKTSVAALSKEEMTQLIDWVLDWAPATLEMIVPPPDKNWRKHAETIRRRGRAA